MADQAKKNLPKRTGKEQKKRAMNAAHARRVKTAEANRKANDKRHEANEKLLSQAGWRGGTQTARRKLLKQLKAA